MVHLISDFPYDSSRILVEIFRTGTLHEKKVEVAEAAWNLAGYSIFLLMDSRAPKPVLHNSTIPTTDADIVSYLEDFNKTHPKPDPTATTPKLNLPFDATKLLKWSTDFISRLA